MNVVRVREGDCPCPGRPHEVELVTLLPELTTALAFGAIAALNAADGLAAKMAALAEAYLPGAITEWTFLDENRQPVPITRDNLELLVPWDKGGLDLGEAADALYSEKLMRPLQERLQRLSRTGSTDDLTSPSLPPGYTPPPPLRPFSPPDTDGKPSEALVP